MADAVIARSEHLMSVGGVVHTSVMESIIDRARDYITAVRWQYAATMPNWPHEYTVKSWRPDIAAEFEAFCQLIAHKGFVEPWPPPSDRPIYRNHYLVIDGHKYWAMGPHGDLDPPTNMTVINRSHIVPEESSSVIGPIRVLVRAVLPRLNVSGLLIARSFLSGAAQIPHLALDDLPCRSSQ